MQKEFFQFNTVVPGVEGSFLGLEDRPTRGVFDRELSHLDSTEEFVLGEKPMKIGDPGVALSARKQLELNAR